MARANAGRAGVAELRHSSPGGRSPQLEPPSGAGWVVTNPPYGVRVSANQDLAQPVRPAGRCAAPALSRLAGWPFCAPTRHLLRQTGLELDNCLSTVNGGINVRLSAGKIPLDINVTS